MVEVFRAGESSSRILLGDDFQICFRMQYAWYYSGYMFESVYGGRFFVLRPLYLAATCSLLVCLRSTGTRTFWEMTSRSVSAFSGTWLVFLVTMHFALGSFVRGRPKIFGTSAEEVVAALVVDLGSGMFIKFGFVLRAEMDLPRTTVTVFGLPRGWHTSRTGTTTVVQLTSAPRCMRALPRGFGYEQFPLCLCSRPCLQTTVSQRSWQRMVQSLASSSFTVTYLCFQERMVQSPEFMKCSYSHPGVDAPVGLQRRTGTRPREPCPQGHRLRN